MFPEKREEAMADRSVMRTESVLQKHVNQTKRSSGVLRAVACAQRIVFFLQLWYPPTKISW